ncbi:RNA polymerase II transcriptional coactivator KELP isoform X2 [Amaranthus tricolor]|uniref:RNA polymerase II transcriptional coactivator KELP isoform X2 n=1 Tax=Amaranthus tricolor TaxID=29722 RepID=UPI00258B951F|nr:RNA polymerase II transcriptional coactivator KELP isoform X2 [Amaranthus tricolor]
MDAATKEKVEETVLEVLRNADMEAMTEFKIRQIATEKLGIDLSEPSRKKFVRQIVEDFLAQQQQQQQHQQQQQQQNDAVSTGEVEEKQEEEDNNNDGREYDDDGDLIVCRLSDKRRVTIQDFRGRTLVSIREYYKKDGKYLPTSKGARLMIKVSREGNGRYILIKILNTLGG